MQPYFISPGEQPGGLFGFAEFIQAFAILILVYTLSDVKYRFRIQAAALPVRVSTFWLVLLIGIASLVVDYWFTAKLPIPTFLPARALIQSMLAGLFLFVLFIWLWFAFLRPPLFSAWNAKRFFIAIRNYLVEGSPSDLSSVTQDLKYSASQIVKYASGIPEPRIPNDPRPRKEAKISQTSEYANALCMILGSKKITRHLAVSSPITAIVFFQEMSEQRRHDIQLGEFASNLVTEALLNEDSIIFQESNRYGRGYLEATQPFIRAVFGDYRLVEGLSYSNGSSSLDLNLDYRLGEKLSAKQLEAYCRGALVTIKSSLQQKYWGEHSFVITRAMHFLSNSVGDLYKLNDDSNKESDAIWRLRVVTDFVDEVIKLLDQHGIQRTQLRKRRNNGGPLNIDLYDQLASLCFELVVSASYVTRKDFTNWDVQHNSTWTAIRSYEPSPVRKIVLYKLRRKIYEEIVGTGRLNYKSARVLGFCLNVLGLNDRRISRIEDSDRALRRAVQSYARKHYIEQFELNPEVASNALVGTITFDRKKRRLVKTYSKGLQRTAPKTFLRLDLPKRSKHSRGKRPTKSQNARRKSTV
jgi:hypothetical protein